MKRLNQENINTPEYFDKQFGEKEVDKLNVMRQEKYLEIIGDCPFFDVVELGCGMSYFPQMAAERYNHAYGLDFAPNTIERLQKEFPKVNYVVGDALHTPFPDGKFNAVVAGEILEHIENPIDLVTEMARICTEGGLIILSTGIIEFNDPEHLWEFDPDEVSMLMESFGETKVEVIESEKFKGRKYIFAWTKKERL